MFLDNQILSYASLDLLDLYAFLDQLSISFDYKNFKFNDSLADQFFPPE